jgi:hypothetical protein
MKRENDRINKLREIMEMEERGEKCRNSFSARISNRPIRCNTGILRALIGYLY